MHFILGSLVVGAIAGEGARKVAWRPFLKGVMKQGIRLQRGVVEMSSGARAEAGRLVSEALAELDHTRPATGKRRAAE